MAVDTFFVGALKGLVKVYLQTVLDCYLEKRRTPYSMFKKGLKLIPGRSAH